MSSIVNSAVPGLFPVGTRFAKGRGSLRLRGCSAVRIDAAEAFHQAVSTLWLLLSALDLASFARVATSSALLMTPTGQIRSERTCLSLVCTSAVVDMHCRE